MAKAKKLHTQFTLREARHFANRGPQAALTAISNAIDAGLEVLYEVWEWVVNFADNSRARELLEKHAPQLIPVKYRLEA